METPKKETNVGKGAFRIKYKNTGKEQQGRGIKKKKSVVNV